MKQLNYFFDGGEDMPSLKSAKLHIPDWFKSIKPIDRNAIPFDETSGKVKFTAKHCVPFFDALSSGYIVELWTDVFVTNRNGYPVCNWTAGPPPILERPPMIGHEDNKLPIPHGHTKTQFTWNIQIVLDTIKNYSILVTHPFNRFDLPFTTMSGIVDLDTSPLFPGRIPFYFKQDFQGMIPQGTPIALIFPFKRENWKAKYDKKLTHKLERHRNTRDRTIIDWYKNLHWVKKEYK